MVTLTPKAATEVKKIIAQETEQGLGLRVGVQGGGCSGLSYLFRLEAKARPTDQVYEFEGVKIFVDPKSLLYLEGMTLDYRESLLHSGFAFDNPNAQKSCGCGSSFTA